MSIFELHYTIKTPDHTPLSILQQETDLSIATIKSAITKGALWITKSPLAKQPQSKAKTQRVRRFKKPLSVDDELHFYYNEQVLNQTPPEAKLIADCQGYSVWYKPYGMLSQGSKWSDHCTIARWAQLHLPDERPCFIVHRLDRATSGLIVIAHSKKVARAFGDIFEHHQLTKCYQAICHGNCLDTSNATTVELAIDGKAAKSHFSLQSFDDNAQLALVDINIETGRKHQIRRHAKHLGMPIVGDRLHGDADKDYPDEINLQLCAVALSFRCPLSQQSVSFELESKLRPTLANITTLIN